jgi:hypothetical protein
MTRRSIIPFKKNRFSVVQHGNFLYEQCVLDYIVIDIIITEEIKTFYGFEGKFSKTFITNNLEECENKINTFKLPKARLRFRYQGEKDQANNRSSDRRKYHEHERP